jgi:Helitron helicase-like domain at N-terminus
LFRYFGPPTFFVTLNPAEWAWPELHGLYASVYNEEVNSRNISKFVALDPVLFADYFSHRIKCVMKTVIQATAMPLGGIANDYWHRKEWQIRGATHTHMLLWIRGAPVVGQSSEDEIVRFIEEHITCRLPDSENEPTLYRLVTQFQMHKCTGITRYLITKIAFAFIIRLPVKPVASEMFAQRARFPAPRVDFCFLGLSRRSRS